MKHIQFDLLKLTASIILGMIANPLLSMTDSYMLGQYSVSSFASASFANSLFFLPLVFMIGFMMPVSAIVSQELAQKNTQKIKLYMSHSFFLCFFLSIILSFALVLAYPLLHYFSFDEALLKQSKSYLDIIMIGLPAFALYVWLKQLADSAGKAHIASLFFIASIPLNALLNYFLIFGNSYFPELGEVGCAIATSFSRFVVLVGFAIYSYKHFKEYLGFTAFDKKVFNEILRIGFPSAMSHLFEVIAFSVCCLIAAKLGIIEIAAFQISLNLASFGFTIALSLAIAGQIRCAYQIGLKDLAQVKKYILATYQLCFILMGVSTFVFIVFRNELANAFSNDLKVVQLASQCILIMGITQIFDGFQACGICLLRAMKDTKVPSMVTLFCYIFVALSLAYYFAFHTELKTPGIWYALGISLVLASLFHLLRIYRNIYSKKAILN